MPSLENPFEFTVHNLEDFLKARRCSEESFDQVKKNTFKYTNCGAWIGEGAFGENLENGIAVGSIVEGADYDTSTYILFYPFEIQEFWDALSEVEYEADQIWKEVNEGDDKDTFCDTKQEEVKRV